MDRRNLADAALKYGAPPQERIHGFTGRPQERQTWSQHEEAAHQRGAPDVRSVSHHHQIEQQQRAAAGVRQQPPDNFLARLEQAEARDSVPPADRPVAHYRRQAQQQQQQQQQMQQMQQQIAMQPHQLHAYQQKQLAPSKADHMHMAGYRREHQPDWSFQDQYDAELANHRYAPPGAQAENRAGVSRQNRTMFKPLASQVDMSQPGVDDRQHQRRANHLATPTDTRMGGRGGTPHDRPAGGHGNLAGRPDPYGVQVRAHHTFF